MINQTKLNQSHFLLAIEKQKKNVQNMNKQKNNAQKNNTQSKKEQNKIGKQDVSY